MSFILTDSKQRKRILGMALATVLATSAFAAPVTSAFATETDPTTTITTQTEDKAAAATGSITVAWKDLTDTTGFYATADATKLPQADGNSVKAIKAIGLGKYKVTYTATGTQPESGSFTFISDAHAGTDGKVDFDSTKVEHINDVKSGESSKELDLTKGGMLVFPKSDVENGTFTIVPVADETTPDKPAAAGVIESTGTQDKPTTGTASSFKIAAGDYTAKWDAKDDKAADLIISIFKPTVTRSASASPDYTGTAKADGAVTWIDKDGKAVDHVSLAADDTISVIGVGKVTFETYKATTPDPDTKPEAKTYTFDADADTPFLGALDQKGLTEGNYVVGVIPNAKDGSVTATIGEPGKDGKVATPVYTITYEAGSAGKKFTVHHVADNVDSTNQVIFLNPSYVLDLQGGSLTFTSTTDHESWNGGASGDESLKPIKTVDIDLTKVKDVNGDGSAILGVVPQAEGDKLPSYVAPSDSKDDTSKDDASKDDTAKARVIAETPDTSDPTVKPEEKPDTTKKAGTYADQFQALEPGIYRVTFTASKSELAKKSVTGAWFDKAETKDGVFNAAEGAKSTPLEVFDATLKADESSPVVETVNLTNGGVLYLNGGADSGTVHLSLMKKAEETPKQDEKPAGDKLANTGVGVIASVLGISALSGAGAGAELLRRKRRGE